MMLATFCGHTMAFYNVFAKNWHLFLGFFLQNHAHSEPSIRLTTPDSLNDHCKKRLQNLVSHVGEPI